MRYFLLAVAIALTTLVGGPVVVEAQTSPIAITLDNCRRYLEQYGTTTSDAALTFQGGSIEAQLVAFCQSLAYRGQRDGLDLGQVFTEQADRDRSGTIDQTEFEAYFTAAREGGSGAATRVATIAPIAPNEPAPAAQIDAPPATTAAGAVVDAPEQTTDAGGSVLPLLTGALVLLAAAGLVTLWRGSATSRRRCR